MQYINIFSDSTAAETRLNLCQLKLTQFRYVYPRVRSGGMEGKKSSARFRGFKSYPD
jgi:hypothetical protein